MSLVIMMMYTVCALLASLSNHVLLHGYSNQIYSISYDLLVFGAYILILRVYLFNHVRAFLEMKRRHNQAYQRHISKGTALIVFTIVAIGIKIF